MKYIIFSAMLMVSMLATAQRSTRSKRVIPVTTVDEAHSYVLKNPKLKAQVVSLNSTMDTTVNDREVYRYKTGDAFSMGGDTYKVLSVLSKKEYKVAYMLIDGSKLNKRTVDSTRALVIDRYQHGTSFDELSKTYATPMSEDAPGVIPEWFDENNVMPELVTAVKTHKKGDVYTVDVPERQWYYVVSSTTAPRQNRSYKLLKVPGLK